MWKTVTVDVFRDLVIKPGFINTFLMCCAIWYHLCNLRNVKNNHGWVLLLLKKPVTLLKVTLLYGCFSLVLNSKDGTKSQKAHLISDTKHFAKDMFFGGYHNYKPYRLLWRGVLQKNCHFQFVEFISSYSSISR